MSSRRLVLLGPPGAGKGTQAALVSKALDVPAISTGDIFRDNVARRTALGQRAQRYMESGEYVPDEVTNEMVRARLAEPDAADGFLLDGYPRTLDQVTELDAMLRERGAELDAVVELTADDEAVVQRLLGRSVEQGRADDTDVVIRRRLEVYHEQTAPLAGHYQERGMLLRVDGIGSIEDVTARLLTALGAQRG